MSLISKVEKLMTGYPLNSQFISKYNKIVIPVKLFSKKLLKSWWLLEYDPEDKTAF